MSSIPENDSPSTAFSAGAARPSWISRDAPWHPVDHSAKPWAPPTAPNALPAANDAPSPKPVTVDAGTGLHEGAIVSDAPAAVAFPPLLVAECRPNKILTKRFGADGTKRDFSAGDGFRYRELPANTFDELLKAITWVSSQTKMCILRGVLHPECPRVDTAPDNYFYRRKNDRLEEPANILEGAFPWVVYDFDETSTPFDLAAPVASIRAWHATLPPELRLAGSAFFPSASAHVSPNVRGKLVVWYGSPITGEQARDFADLYRADPSVGHCYQPNYFAAPVFDGCSDPLAGARAPILFEGEPATQPAPAALKAHRDRPAPVPLGECPPGDKGILATLGPADAQIGKRFAISGHLGGIMRRLGFEREACAAILTDWIPANELAPRLEWALGAWDKEPNAVSGEDKLAELVGTPHAAVIVEACTRARPPALIAHLAELTATIERHQAAALEVAISTPAPIAVLASERSWIKNGAAAFDERPPIPFLIEELAIAPGPPTMVVALGYVGKSLILLSLLLSIASGRIPVWGLFSVTRPGRSIFLDYEGPDVLLQERMQRLAVGMGLSRDVTAMVDHGRPPVYLDGNREYVKAWLVATLTGYVAAVVDSFRVACPMLEENDSRAGIPLDLLAEVSEITGCVVFVIHHASKPSKDADGEVNPRGSTALFNACGTVLTLSSDDPEGPKRVQHTKAKFARRPVAPFMIRIEDLPAVGKLEPVRVVALDKANHEANELSMNEARILEALKAAPGPFLSIGETKADRAPGRLMAACKMGSKAFEPAFASLKERSERFPHVEGLEDRGKGLARTVTYRKAGRLSPSAIEALQREP